MAEFRKRGQEQLFRCGGCGGTSFTSRHIHNPYGHDRSTDIARCDNCGAEWQFRHHELESVVPAEGSSD